jgi:hypothetical protein
MAAAFDDGAHRDFGEYETYEDYLDSQIKPEDRKYLEDEEMAHFLVELGYRVSGETMKREDFEARKAQMEKLKEKSLLKQAKPLSNAGFSFEGKPFLQALADREGPVRNGKLSCIIFVRHTNQKKQEVSGYIDYGHRLITEDFVQYFSGKKPLLPRPSDLSYYNWETQLSTSNSTPNFQVKADNGHGLIFKNKRDRKPINVDPKVKEGPGDDTTRKDIATSEFGNIYHQVVFFDHKTRRKA